MSSDTAWSFVATDPGDPLRATWILRLPESRLKRRNFLAASALLSLLAPSSVLAANKKKATTNAPAKSAGKIRSTTKKTGRPSVKPVVDKPATPVAAGPLPAEAEQRDNYYRTWFPEEYGPTE